MSRCVLVIVVSLFSGVAQGKPPTKAELIKILKTIDDRMRSPGDYQAQVYVEYKQTSQEDLVYQMNVLRRDKDEALLMLTTEPKTMAGQGYLRLSKNMWFYNPTAGKWSRRTARDRISGTGARRRDFDQWNLAGERDPTYLAQEKIGSFIAHKIRLVGKPNIEVAVPILYLWVDSKTNNPLKMESRSVSNKLLYTNYYPKWAKVKKSSTVVYYPKEIRIFNEVDKGEQTLLLVRKAIMAPLPGNIFTKAWVESKAR